MPERGIFYDSLFFHCLWSIICVFRFCSCLSVCKEVSLIVLCVFLFCSGHYAIFSRCHWTFYLCWFFLDVLCFHSFLFLERKPCHDLSVLFPSALMIWILFRIFASCWYLLFDRHLFVVGIVGFLLHFRSLLYLLSIFPLSSMFLPLLMFLHVFNCCSCLIVGNKAYWEAFYSVQRVFCNLWLSYMSLGGKEYYLMYLYWGFFVGFTMFDDFSTSINHVYDIFFAVCILWYF